MTTRLLVCGGRNFTDRNSLFAYLDAFATEKGQIIVIHGAARGADALAGEWADSRGHVVISYPADWETHGKQAGPIRNEKMLQDGKPEWVIAFPGGCGTSHMIGIARRAGVPVLVPPISTQGEA